ncbi:MAG TPA: B12-binding domain-containing radical SAM protein, partial [Thermodesulfobacterium commune]|nr:B12-binding domain-containing radical SAM protein [Thermodesulfobacterium commune]
VIKDLVKIGAVVHAHTFIPLPQTPFLYKPPVKLSGDLIKLIKSLTGKGLLFGDWEAQQKLSQKIYNYFKS